MIRRVAPTDVTVLVTGQSGTGKDLVAREVHRLSSRAANPFITVSCGVLPEPALEVELFGPPQNEKGAALKGRLRAAHGGTVFLDEIDQIPAGLQAKLVQFLEQQDRDYSGGGSGLDVRILASSSIDIRDRVAGGVFRDDLFFRPATSRQPRHCKRRAHNHQELATRGRGQLIPIVIRKLAPHGLLEFRSPLELVETSPIGHAVASIHR